MFFFGSVHLFFLFFFFLGGGGGGCKKHSGLRHVANIPRAGKPRMLHFERISPYLAGIKWQDPRQSCQGGAFFRGLQESSVRATPNFGKGSPSRDFSLSIGCTFCCCSRGKAMFGGRSPILTRNSSRAPRANQPDLTGSGFPVLVIFAFRFLFL